MACHTPIQLTKALLILAFLSGTTAQSIPSRASENQPCALHQADSAASVLAENVLGFINDTLYHRLAELWPESEGKWDGKDIEKTLAETEIWLGQNVPNPATNRTTIPYKVPVGVDAYLEISDLHGRRIAFIQIPAGYNTLELSLQELPSGIIIYRLVTNGYAPISRTLINL